MLNINEIKNFYNNYYKEYIEQALIEYDNIPNDMRDDETETLFEDIIPESLCYTGCEKICIAFNDEDFVFKFARDKYNLCCQTEVKSYIAAKKENLDKVFLAIEYLDTIKGFDIFVQEKIDECFISSNSYKSYVSSSREEQCKLVESIVNTLNLDNDNIYFDNFLITEMDIPAPFLNEMIDYYGKTFVKTLLQFLQDNEIYDLHGGNVGYIHNNIPILFDYAGIPI